MATQTKPKPKFEVREYTTKKDPVAPSPSASIILVSPTNQILLLHRVKSSSAFPSAHVFPGGNLDPQDGSLPSDPTDPARHMDSLAYRTGAIRELFEETGILLAKDSAEATSLLPVSPEARLAGRKAVHSGKTTFKDWLKSQSQNAVLHTEGLIPFSHWITPP
jgi:8-oxo-dGTP pyrophosphatase MutT (NUDIX family)